MDKIRKKSKHSSSPKGSSAKNSELLANTDALKNDQDAVPIAAIGASAGGLEPIETFFDAMPPDSGCAFIIIQHLSPDFRSLMDELLARHSSMSIHRVTDGMIIEPNSIYLNPPRSVMTIVGNRLQVEGISAKDTVYLPIDLFFESLANSRGENAIGLVFSGTGSDGTRGAKYISESDGTVLVQDPATTRFDGMPKSVIAEGNFELVAAPTDLARCVRQLLNSENIDVLSTTTREPLEEPLQDLLSMLKHRYGTDFLQYKEATVKRRIERRAQMNRISDINDYRDLLNTDELELQELYADLLIEVTEFFRDPEAFEVVRNRVLPRLMENCKDGDSVRVWVPGCASGEEAYSIAILLQEQARVMGIYPQLKILATDIHIRSMNKASAGIYTEESLKGVPNDLVARYFDIADGHVQIKPTIRNMVFFSTHDVMRDPPFTRIDLVSCRNLLIYLNEDAQEKVINLLHFALRKSGYLFLGPSEHIGAIAHEFDAVSDKWRIYEKRRDIKLLPAESIFQRADMTKGMPRSNRSRFVHKANEPSLVNDQSISFKRAQRVALEEIVSEFAPPGFLLTDNGTIVHIFGNAGTLLPMQSGSFSKSVIDLIRPDLKVIVTAALDQARNREFTEFKRAAYVKDEEAASSTYEILLRALDMPGEAQRFLLLSVQKKITNEENQNTLISDVQEFAEDESAEAFRQRILVLEHSLRSSEESLQSTIEELETSNEELQSTNEELMSTNEELQSTNEELHSVNEELYTVSAEHQRKNQELTERDNDLDTLLHLSKIGTVHLDEDLTLLRFTPGARSVFNIMPQDVGRPFSHITIVSDEYDVLALVEEVKNSQVVREVQLKVRNSEYILRILPHHKDDDYRQGVLITVIDISDLQSVRSELKDLNIQYKDIVENTESFIVRWDAKTEKIAYCNSHYASILNSTPELLVGKSIAISRKPEEAQIFRDSLSSITLSNSVTGVYLSTDEFEDKRYSRITTRAIGLDDERIDFYQSMGNDCTEEQNYQNAVDRLSDVFSSSTLDPEAKLEAILDIGLEYYGLDTAIISSISANTYEIKTLVSRVDFPLTVGTVLELEDTLCSQFVDEKNNLAINDISNSEINDLPCHQFTGIESFVGASVRTANGPYGSISLSSKKPRARSYTTGDESFSLLLAGWVGFLLGNIEQLDFMSNQNDYYKTLFKSVPTMLFLCDSEGLILSVSDLFSEQVHQPPELVPGKNCIEFFEKTDAPLLKSKLLEGVGSAIPAKISRGDQPPLEVELNMSIKQIGTLQGIRMVIVTDVSPRNKASREAAEKNRSLEVANESLNQFAFIASHDLQEPLRKIQQFSSFLEEDLGEALDEDGRYHLNVIVDASQRMSTLIHDLLSYSGTSKVEASLEELKLEPLVRAIVDDLEFPDENSKIKFDFDSLPVVLGNKPLLNQLFTNLISNSIKYRVVDRPLEISVAAKKCNKVGTIVLSDNGIGFDMQYAKKIFEPFSRLHNTKQYRGNGIGLAICQTVCEKHGWKIEASGIPNHGTTFTITMNHE